jgi:hypothetical protein
MGAQSKILLLHVYDVSASRKPTAAVRDVLERLRPGETVSFGNHYWVLLTDTESGQIPVGSLPDQTGMSGSGLPGDRSPGTVPLFCSRCGRRSVKEVDVLELAVSYLRGEELSI